jgi:Holliday junction DNA helicase RuvA
MIDYIKGILTRREMASAVVEACGVGYFCEIPLSTSSELPSPGQEVTLITHHLVREDAQKLFGFLTRDERELFRRLISINKIGPKVALAILSHVSVAQMVQCVALGDAAPFKAVPGVGLKTAQRLVIELRGKLDDLSAEAAVHAGASVVSDTAPSLHSDAAAALTALGYSEKQVQSALARIASLCDDSTPLEEIIKKALQVI